MANVKELYYKPEDIQQAAEGELAPSTNIPTEKTQPHSEGTSFPDFNFFGVDSQSMVNKPNWTQRDLDLALGGMYPDERLDREKKKADIDKTKADTYDKLRGPAPGDPWLKNESGDIYHKLPDGTLDWAYLAAKTITGPQGQVLGIEEARYNPKYMNQLPGQIAQGQDGSQGDQGSGVYTLGSDMSGNNMQNLNIDTSTFKVYNSASDSFAGPINGLYNNPNEPFVILNNDEVKEITLEDPNGDEVKGSIVYRNGLPVVMGSNGFVKQGNVTWDNAIWAIEPSYSYSKDKRINQEQSEIDKIVANVTDGLKGRFEEGLFQYLDEGGVQVDYKFERAGEADVALQSEVHKAITNNPNLLLSRTNVYSRTKRNGDIFYTANNKGPQFMVHDKFRMPTYCGTVLYGNEMYYLWTNNEFSVVVNGENYNGDKLSQLPQPKLQEIINSIGTNNPVEGALVFCNKAGEIMSHHTGKDINYTNLYNEDLYHYKKVNGKNRLVYKGSNLGK